MLTSYSRMMQINEIYDKRRKHMEDMRRDRIAEINKRIPEIKRLREKIITLISDIAVLKVSDNRQNDLIEEKEACLQDLRKTQNELLLAYGYSKDDFKVKYFCPLCKDTGYVDSNKCSCMLELEKQLLYDNLDFREYIKDNNFSNFSLSYYTDYEKKQSAKLAKDRAYDMIHKILGTDAEYDVDNLYIYGCAGVGKTFLAHCIINELIKNGVFVLYFSARDIFNILRLAALGTTEKDNKNNGYIGDMPSYTDYDIYEAEVLVIDDLGVESASNFVSSALFKIIDERLMKKKHTVIVSDCPINILNDRYGDKVMSRIVGSYELLKIDADDIRLLKKTQKKEEKGGRLNEHSGE